MRKNLNEQYNPMYHLAALGSGGLSISFFLYLNFMLPHESGIICFDQLWPILNGEFGYGLKFFLVALDLALVLLLALTSLSLMVWNTREFARYKKTEAYTKLRNSMGEISLMVVPLTMAMTVNVLFVTSSLLVPGMWDYIETLFPFAMAAFLVIGGYAMRILGDYVVRMLLHKGYNFEEGNSLAAMIAIFALAMVAVGLAAPAAFSSVKEIVAIATALSSFFATAGVVLMVIMLVIGFQAMLTHGIRLEAAPSLWLMIPILTLYGITFMRITHGLHESFDAHISSGEIYPVLMALISVQLMFGMIGYAVMKRLNYFKDFIYGDKIHATTFALICPGVAFPVFGLFVVKFGLLGNGLFQIFTWPHLLFLLPFFLVQLKTLQVLFTLLRRMDLLPSFLPFAAPQRA